MSVSASDVKRLRDETDAPMMECRAALEEAGGDFEKAKSLLREKGKAAAAKRADRSTSEGVAFWAISPDLKTAGGVILECETDFVAKNADFVATVEQVASAFVANDPGANPLEVQVDGKTVGTIVQEAVAKFRENVQLTKAVRLTSNGAIGIYNHHDRKKAAAVVLEGDANTLVDAGRKLAIQCVALNPSYVRKEDIDASVIEREIEIETQRALNEGKPENIARNVAQGRVNKEFFKSQVLLEQDFYEDLSKSVSAYIQEAAKAGGGAIDVKSFARLAVGES
jgi:elongation factor Ts